MHSVRSVVTFRIITDATPSLTPTTNYHFLFLFFFLCIYYDFPMLDLIAFFLLYSHAYLPQYPTRSASNI